MSDLTDEQIETYRECLTDIEDQNFAPNEIEVMIKIFRWTSTYFIPQSVVHTIPNYRKHVRKLRARALIQAVQSNSLSKVHKITQDGQRTGYIMLLLRDLDWL